MQNKEKIALFDFCETLANFQTADAFVSYIREKSGRKSMLLKERFRMLLKCTKLLTMLTFFLKRSSINKRLILWQLRGFSKIEIETYAKSYYEEKVRLNLIRPVVDQLVKLQNDGWRICIVSAGYEIYLKHFCIEYNIPLDDLIAVKIGFCKGYCTGTFDGGDRLWDKTKKLEERFEKQKIISVAYSDSLSDLSLLTWANEGIVIRRSDKQQWSNQYNFKEIVWYQK